MKIKWLPLLLCCFSSLFGASETTEEINFDTLSEALGHFIVRGLDQAGFNLNLDKVISGIQDARAGKPSPMNEDEYEQLMCQLQEQRFNQIAEQNLSEANAFLKVNASKEGVQTVEQNLQYVVSQEGSGELVGTDSTPLIHYTGKLIDGTVFTSSAEIGEPVALPIKQSIPGIAKGVVGMKEGEKRVLYIHPELAYGLSDKLPPNSLLIFEVEVVKADALIGNAESIE